MSNQLEQAEGDRDRAVRALERYQGMVTRLTAQRDEAVAAADLLRSEVAELLATVERMARQNAVRALGLRD